MTANYQIERIDYDLINKALNIDNREKNLLFGHSNKFIAAKQVKNGYIILINTIGRRDECLHSLKEYLSHEGEA